MWTAQDLNLPTATPIHQFVKAEWVYSPPMLAVQIFSSFQGSYNLLLPFIKKGEGFVALRLVQITEKNLPNF